MPNQNTIVKALNFNGVGLHTGKNAKIIVEPAAVNHGIKFQRVDVENQPIISADVNLVTDTKRSTTLEKNNVKVITVEHLMSALYALKINNALIKIDSPEIPILHGSAKQYVDAILKVGVKQQSEKIEFLKLNKPLSYTDVDSGSEILYVPSEDFKVSVVLDYGDSVLGTQYA